MIRTSYNATQPRRHFHATALTNDRPAATSSFSYLDMSLEVAVTPKGQRFMLNRDDKKVFDSGRHLTHEFSTTIKVAGLIYN